MVELLRPQHSRERLAHDALRVAREVGRDHRRVELVGLALARGEDLRRAIERRPVLTREPQMHRLALSGADLQSIMRGALAAGLLLVHRA